MRTTAWLTRVMGTALGSCLLVGTRRRALRTTRRFAAITPLLLAATLVVTGAGVALAGPVLADDGTSTTTVAVVMPAPLDALVDGHGVLDFVTAVAKGADPAPTAAAALRRAEATSLLVASLPDDGSRLQLLDDSAWLLAFTGTGGHLITTGTGAGPTTDRVTATAFGLIRPALAQGPHGLVEEVRAILANVTSARTSDVGVSGGLPYTDTSSVSDEYDSLTSTAADLVVEAEQIVDALRHTYVMGNQVPSPDEVVTDANAVLAYLQNAVGSLPPPGDLVTEVGTVANALLQQVDVRPMLNQADTVLLYLGNQVNPLIDGTAPTRDQALTAAESLAGWADDQAGQDPAVGVDYPDTLVPDTSDVSLTDTGVMVAGAPEPTPMRPYSTVPDVDGLALTAGAATGCASNVPCAPPLVNPTRNPVQHDPTVYLVFWGPKWTDAAHSAQRSALAAFAGGLSGSAFQAVLDQYYDTKGHIGTAVTFGGAWIDGRTPPGPLAPVGDVDLATEAAYAHGHNSGWRAGRDAQYLIFPQEGASDFGYSGACGHHDSGGTDPTNPAYIFSHVRYPTGPECTGYAFGDVTKTLLLVASHEYAEAVTDPYVGIKSKWAWHDGGGYEIADMCDIGTPWGTVGGQPVTQLWNNAANNCTYGFGRGASYQVVSTVDPAGAPWARGHAYAGGKVVVRNTGSVAWYTTGTHPVRLMTKSNACSHFYDPPTSDTTTARKDPASTWVNCTRIKGTTWDGVVGPGELLAFTLPLRADGTLADNKPGLRQAETFDLDLEGLYRVPLHDGSYPALGGTIATHDALRDAADSTPTAKVVVASAGTDTPVAITTHVEGTATWWGNEVVNLATAGPLNRPSAFAASNWPKAPGVACTRCRADRVRTTTAPNATYTFTFMLHIPATTTVGLHPEAFEPVVDVPIVGGGIQTKELSGGRVTINLIVLPPPVASHEVTGVGVDGPMGSSGPTVAEPTATPATSAWVACAAAADADALTTTVNWCDVTVDHVDGTSAEWGWPSDPTYGPAAVAVMADVPYHQAGGDTITVCWNVSATYPDGSQHSNSGCNGG